MERAEIIPKSFPTNLLKKDWTQRKCFYRKKAVDFIHLVHDMVVFDDDVWLVTLPKCGTTWMQELLWLVLNDYDFEAAKQEHLEIRTPYMEFDFMVNEDLSRALKPVENLKSPRLIKSHLPLPLLPAQIWQKKPKLIYVYRNPKDAIVSEYYHGRSCGFDMDKTCEQSFNNYIDHSSLTQLPFEHVTEFYALRHEPWLLYTSFERMKSNLSEVIMEVVQFLNKSITQQQMQQMLEHLSFKSMKENPKTNHHWEFEQIRRHFNSQSTEEHSFVRKGQVGGYKDELSPATIAKCDQWIQEQLKPYNLTLNELLLVDEQHKKQPKFFHKNGVSMN